jgi:hypothetical protein
MDFPYNGSEYRTGQELDVLDKDVEILTIAGRIGSADEVPAARGKRNRPYRRRDQVAE